MKWIWVAFIIWCAIVLFVPMVHVIPAPTNTLAVAEILVCLPWLILVVLWYLHKHPDSFLKSLITIDIASGIVFISILFLIGHLVVQNLRADGIVWAHSATLITVLFLILLLMRKYALRIEESEAVLLAIIVGAFAIGGFEIPYILTLPIVGLSPDIPILIQFCFLILPFGVVLYKQLCPSKYTVVLFLMWIGFWCIWVFPMERWDINLAENTANIHWLPYQFTKGIKLFLVPLLYSLNVRQSIAFIKPLPVV